MKEIKKIAPNLSKINKGKHFTLPEGYFDSFHVRLKEKIRDQKDKGAYQRHVLTLKPYIAIAAVFLGLVILGRVSYELLNKSGSGTNLGSDEVAALIEDDIYHYSEDLIIDVIYMKESKSVHDGMESKNDVNTDDIIDYLIDENIDLLDIIEAL